MSGVMAPPTRYPSRPLMLAAAAPLHAPRGLMSPEAAAFEGFDVHRELTRLLWAAVVVVSLVIYLWHVTAR
ncbi:MAG TPA: hypothetical protein VGH79_12135 [Gaiellaceae bacterium]|jgi:hypothetical protein